MDNFVYDDAIRELKTHAQRIFGDREKPIWPIDAVKVIKFREIVQAICQKYPYKNTWKFSSIHPTASIDDTVILGDGVQVFPGSVIWGNCIIGARAKIGPSAFIHEKCWIGEDAVVGHSCEVKKSILLDHTKVYHYGFIGDSVIGFDSNIGAGTIFAVKLLNGKKIKIHSFANEEGDTLSIRKFGAIVGNDVQFGVNVSVMPGSIINPNQTIYPGTIVKDKNGS